MITVHTRLRYGVRTDTLDNVFACVYIAVAYEEEKQKLKKKKTHKQTNK